MMKNTTIPIRFGIGTSGSLIAYFLTLAALGLHTNGYYSLFNGVLTGFGIYEAIKYYRFKNPETFTYAKGFITGVVTGFTTTFIFTLFFALYATELNTTFLKELLAAGFKNYSTSEGAIFFIVAIMGLTTTVVLTLTFMQLFKVSNNLRQETRLNSKNHL